MLSLSARKSFTSQSLPAALAHIYLNNLSDCNSSRNEKFLLKVLRNLLADDEDMMSLSLTNQNEKEDIELLLSSVAADLDEIETEIKIFIDMIEDTDQFISAHLDSVRNEIIKMSLFIEVGGLIMVKY